jgi:hypothetical protein
MTPYIIDVAGGRYDIRHNPSRPSASIEIVDSLSLNVFWELYYSVSLLYGTDPSFITVDGSLNDVTTRGVFDRSDTGYCLLF